MVLTDDKDKVEPQKKKNRARVPGKNHPDTGTDNDSVNEGPNRSKTRVFSQGPEETQDTHANTEVSNDLEGAEDASIGGDEATEEERASDEDEDEGKWDYSQLEKMATEDAKVSN